MNKEEKISLEIIAAVKDIMSNALGVNFDEAFSAYVDNNQDQELTEANLVSEILEAGGYQAEDGSGFDDVVTIGLYTVGPTIGFM